MGANLSSSVVRRGINHYRPHLYMHSGVWVCAGVGRRGYGFSWRTAVEDWMTRAKWDLS